MNISMYVCSSFCPYKTALKRQCVAATCYNWTLLILTEMSCPPNSKYNSCMTACPASCSDMTSPSECESPCVEGCECLPGYVLSDSECVPYRECGCTYLDKYYEVQCLSRPDSSRSAKQYFLVLIILIISLFSSACNFALETKSKLFNNILVSGGREERIHESVCLWNSACQNTLQALGGSIWLHSDLLVNSSPLLQ